MVVLFNFHTISCLYEYGKESALDFLEDEAVVCWKGIFWRGRRLDTWGYETIFWILLWGYEIFFISSMGFESSWSFQWFASALYLSNFSMWMSREISPKWRWYSVHGVARASVETIDDMQIFLKSRTNFVKPVFASTDNIESFFTKNGWVKSQNLQYMLFDRKTFPRQSWIDFRCSFLRI